jgi:hypothetical protein
MFLHEFDPKHFGAADPERLATFDEWVHHYAQPRYSHGTPDSREAWAELSATTEAITRGLWSSGDVALDYAVAISSYPDFLSLYDREKVSPRRRRIDDLLQASRGISEGDVVVGLDHRLNRRRPTISVGVVGVAGLNLVPESHTGFAGSGKLVIDTGNTYLRSRFTASSSGLVAEEVEVVKVDDDLPVHGTFDRPEFVTHPWEHVTLDPGFSTYSKMFGPSTIRPYELHLGEEGLDEFLEAKLPDRNILQPYLIAVRHLVERVQNPVQVK